MPVKELLNFAMVPVILFPIVKAMNQRYLFGQEGICGQTKVSVHERVGGAGWRRSKGLSVPPGTEFACLPPHSPELNPAEWLRRHTLRNRLYNRIDEVMDSLQARFKSDAPPSSSRYATAIIYNIRNRNYY